MIHVEHVMGMAVTIDVRGPCPDRAVDAALFWLHSVDAMFSTYKPVSPISRLATGELGVDDDRVPDVVRHVLAECDAMRELTDGYFDAWAGGALDPSGYVKGWAVEEASRILADAGAANHALNAGGDIRLRGTPGERDGWRVGVAHPLVRDAMCAVIDVEGGAVATSGIAERGAHVVDPHTGRAALDLASVTVIGPELTRADVYATAAVAMGLDAPEWLTERVPDGFAAYVVDSGGYEWATTNWPATIEEQGLN